MRSSASTQNSGSTSANAEPRQVHHRVRDADPVRRQRRRRRTRRRRPRGSAAGATPRRGRASATARARRTRAARDRAGRTPPRGARPEAIAGRNTRGFRSPSEEDSPAETADRRENRGETDHLHPLSSSACSATRGESQQHHRAGCPAEPRVARRQHQQRVGRLQAAQVRGAEPRQRPHRAARSPVPASRGGTSAGRSPRRSPPPSAASS